MKIEVVPVTAFHQNCSIVWCENTRRAAVVDPGGDLDRVLAAVERHGLTLEKILITHAHLDHAGATAELARRYSLPIEGPQIDDQFWIDQMPVQAKMFGFPPSERFTPIAGLHRGTVSPSVRLSSRCFTVQDIHLGISFFSSVNLGLRSWAT